MKALLIMALFVTASLHAAEPLPEAYAVIAKRNIFDPTRAPRPTRSETVERPTPPPEAPKRTVRLVGVVVRDGEAVAIFSGSDSSLSGMRRPGDSLAGMRLSGIDTAGVTLTGESGDIRLSVGGGLAGREGEPWAQAQVPVSERPVSSPASSTESSSGGASQPESTDAAPVSGGGAADLLQRMRERRQREMK